MTLTTLVRDLGENADYLIKSDQWLEEERKGTADAMNDLAEKLSALMLAQNIKKLLQDQNMVALQELLRNSNGEIEDIIIAITNLPDAVVALKNPRDTDDQINTATQLLTWENDGYDIRTSAALRKNL
jgi:hypothetical protein